MITSPQSALSVRSMGVSFGGVRALDGVDLDVAEGEIVGLIGPNGAGKTTLFDCISGLAPGEGTVSVAGRDITRMAPHARAHAGLGRSFQDARLFTSMTVLDTLRVAGERNTRRHASVVMTLLGLGGVPQEEQQATERALEVVQQFGRNRNRGVVVRNPAPQRCNSTNEHHVVDQRPHDQPRRCIPFI